MLLHSGNGVGMITYDRLFGLNSKLESEIQDRDIAIIDLYDELKKLAEITSLRGNASEEEAARQNKLLKRYEEFVQRSREIYGR
jgi:hypothetical protein